MLNPCQPPADGADQLRTVGLLASLSSDSLERLAVAAEWLDVPGGTELFRQGDPPDGVYFVLGGRVRVSRTDGGGGDPLVIELGRGEPVGELGLLVAAPRSATVTTTRRSRLVRLSTADFERLVQADPAVALSLTRTLARRMLLSQDQSGRRTSVTAVAVVTTRQQPDQEGFVDALCEALAAHRSVERVATTDLTGPALGIAIDRAEAAGRVVVGHVRLAGAPGAAEFLSESDRVLVVVDGATLPSHEARDPVRAVLDALAPLVTAELVLLHRAPERPRATSRWLERFGFDAHHHVRSGGTADVQRLARHLVGKSVCLVLGGGGAKAFAHIGAYRALLEDGVPVDRVGGSSMGAVIAAQIAAGMSPDQMHEVNRREWGAARINRRFALPVVSLLSLRTAIPMFDRMFEDRALEDLWVPCFATTVDLNGCRLVGHTRGGVARWVRASASPPGIWPPVMADDGSLHVDGGVLDNLPVQIMRQTGPGRIATVNVSPYQPMLFRRTGPHAGGSLRLLPGLLGAGRHGPSPNIVRILYRTVVVTSLNTQARAKAASDFYIEPKVGHIALTDYDRIDDIVAAGYDAARRELDRSGPSLLEG